MARTALALAASLAAALIWPTLAPPAPAVHAAPALPAIVAQSADVTGPYTSDFGPAALERQGDTISGFWQQPSGLGSCVAAAGCRGAFSNGRLSPDGTTLELTWSQSWNNWSGRLRCRVAPAQLTCTYDTTQGPASTGDWNFRRSSPAPTSPTPTQARPTAAPTASTAPTAPTAVPTAIPIVPPAPAGPSGLITFDQGASAAETLSGLIPDQGSYVRIEQVEPNFVVLNDVKQFGHFVGPTGGMPTDPHCASFRFAQPGGVNRFVLWRMGVVNNSSTPAWLARGFDATGTQIGDAVGEGDVETGDHLGFPPAPEPFALVGPGIERLEVCTHNQLSTFWAVPLAAIEVDPAVARTPAPPPVAPVTPPAPAQPTASTTPQTVNVAGAYTSDFGPATLERQGDTISGFWQQPGGVGSCPSGSGCRGTLSNGRLSPDGRTLELTWSQSWNSWSGRLRCEVTPAQLTCTYETTQGSGGSGSWNFRRT